jgi:hypothetical protein
MSVHWSIIPFRHSNQPRSLRWFDGNLPFSVSRLFCPVSIRVIHDNEFRVKNSGGKRGPVQERVLNWRMSIIEQINHDSRAVARGGQLS